MPGRNRSPVKDGLFNFDFQGDPENTDPALLLSAASLSCPLDPQKSSVYSSTTDAGRLPSRSSFHPVPLSVAAVPYLFRPLFAVHSVHSNDNLAHVHWPNPTSAKSKNVDQLERDLRFENTRRATVHTYLPCTFRERKTFVARRCSVRPRCHVLRSTPLQNISAFEQVGCCVLRHSCLQWRDPTNQEQRLQQCCSSVQVRTPACFGRPRRARLTAVTS